MFFVNFRAWVSHLSLWVGMIVSVHMSLLGLIVQPNELHNFIISLFFYRKRYMQKCNELFNEKSNTEYRRVEKVMNTKEMMRVSIKPTDIIQIVNGDLCDGMRFHIR